MLIRLIPSILLLEGRCVKGRNFGSYRDTGNPLTVARVYDAQGADELLFLDITASREGRPALLDVVGHVAEECFMPLGVGGGVRDVSDFRALLRAGADKVCVNSGVVERPELITEAAERFGEQCVVLSVDVRKTDTGYEVMTRGASEATGLDPLEWVKRAVDLGAGEVLITSIERDGTMDGYDIDLIRSVSEAVSVPVIAGGGCGNLEDLVTGVNEGGAAAVSTGSMLHFTDQSVIKARAHMRNRGVPVRIA